MATTRTAVRTLLLLGLSLPITVMGCGSDSIAPELTSSVGTALAPDAPVMAVTRNVHVYREFTLYNQCTGEYVDFSGTFHNVVRSHEDGAGGYHLGFTQNVHDFIGVGQESGTVYHVNGVYRWSWHARGPFPETINESFQRHWISEGSGQDVHLNGQYRITVNANGEVTQMHFDPISLECRG